MKIAIQRQHQGKAQLKDDLLPGAQAQGAFFYNLDVIVQKPDGREGEHEQEAGQHQVRPLVLRREHQR